MRDAYFGAMKTTNTTHRSVQQPSTVESLMAAGDTVAALQVAARIARIAIRYGDTDVQFESLTHLALVQTRCHHTLDGESTMRRVVDGIITTHPRNPVAMPLSLFTLGVMLASQRRFAEGEGYYLATLCGVAQLRKTFGRLNRLEGLAEGGLGAIYLSYRALALQARDGARAQKHADTATALFAHGREAFQRLAHDSDDTRLYPPWMTPLCAIALASTRQLSEESAPCDLSLLPQTTR